MICVGFVWYKNNFFCKNAKTHHSRKTLSVVVGSFTHKCGEGVARERSFHQMSTIGSQRLSRSFSVCKSLLWP